MISIYISDLLFNLFYRGPLALEAVRCSGGQVASMERHGLELSRKDPLPACRIGSCAKGRAGGVLG
jgi:hypothetical protein